MKIVIISDSAPPLSMGGVSSSHYMLHTFLLSHGFDSHIVTFCDAKNNSNADPRILRSQKTPLITKVLKAVIKAFFLLSDRQKVACQTSLILENIQGYYQAAKALRRLSPDLIFAPDYCAPLMFLKGKKGAKLVEIEHHNPSRFADTLLYQRKTHTLDIKISMWLQQRALKNVDSVICPSQYMKGVFQKTHSFAGELRCIPNLVDTGVFKHLHSDSVAIRLGLPPSTPVVYIPSGSTLMKGERYLLLLLQMIFSERKDICFFISGRLTDGFSAELDVSGLKNRVYSPGFKPYMENLALAKSCAVCVAPSIAENYSMALIEALALGMPVATFDVGGNSEIVSNGCGRVVQFLDFVALRDAALHMLEYALSDPECALATIVRAEQLEAEGKEKILDFVRTVEANHREASS